MSKQISIVCSFKKLFSFACFKNNQQILKNNCIQVFEHFDDKMFLIIVMI